MPSDAPGQRVLDAALVLFADQGYHGTSIREIAAGAGLSVPGVYHHHPSKQAVLVALMVTVLEDLLQRSRAVPPGDAGERFDALVEVLLRFHVEHQAEAFVASTELRSLEPANRERVVALRDEQQRLLDEVVREGVAAGAFGTPYAEEAARSVAVLCVGVATWFRADGPQDADAVVARHVDLCRALVRAR